MRKKLPFLILCPLLAGYMFHAYGMDIRKSVVIAIFTLSIIGTLFFWSFRLSFVFIGSGIFLLIRAVNLDEFIKYASLDVILFLISMMIIVGMMKEAGFFEWCITSLLRIPNLTGIKLFLLLMFASAILSSLMGEVASIIMMVTVILNICYFLELAPLPLIISSVMATNIGSAGTVLGNPVGVLIAARSGLSFEDFLLHALPLSTFILFVIIIILCFIYKDYIGRMSSKLKVHQENKGFLYLISIPPNRKTLISMGIFGTTILLIGLHRRLELLFGLEENTLLIMIPVISAGIVMLYRHDKARYYVEREVEWNSLLFFMFLFAQAGVIQATGIADFAAHSLIEAIGNNPKMLASIILLSNGFLSSILDNVIAVAAYMPIIQSLDVTSIHDFKHLWWALLFGACYGGNITMVGSTANIVALGLLEKERNIKIRFSEWFKVGLTVGLVSMGIAVLALFFIPLYS